MDLILVSVVLASVLALVYASWTSKRRGMPPGPAQRIFGSRKPSTVPPWKIFAALHKQYGKIFSFYQGSTPVVVLGTIKAATDLLDKRGSIYSSRPRNIMAGELLSGGMRGLGMPYGTRWRNWRALMHAGMSVEASQNYKILQSLESKILLRDLLSASDSVEYSAHLRRFAISVVFCVAYGRRVLSLDDPLVVENMKTDECYIRMSTPGRYIVESWPILLKLPHFLQWFRAEPLAQRARDTALYTRLMEGVREQMKVGVAQSSTARWGLEKQAEWGLNDLEMAFALSAPFSAGVGTTLATFDVFLLAMLCHPEVMKKAQAELDGIVGPHRLPDFEDAESLPYLRAAIKESMRWRPVAPLGVPHSVIAEDMYESMYVPKGTTVYANIIAMSKDEEVFSSPEEFRPERYLDEMKSDSKVLPPQSTFFFGFGRRVCPGMHVGQNSLFILAARLLWAFDINRSGDATGESVLPDKDDFIGGLVIRPRPFAYSLDLRSEDRRSLILEESRKALDEASMWG
ncbi:unnamed protein product [Cyclocybe aegerita]|uniref:Cytochrome P450 n=1 Tax=Cyclocybe aegerita TaxID=1973307 RepID=A0A8S0X1S2_CYCAE|nr:unnamed protein product [Cyclocybe aegerita]